MLCQQILGFRRTTPVNSPHSSPNASRRSPTSYHIGALERHSRRDRNGDIDSGVYSANSSRDGTPVRGHHVAGEGAHPTAPVQATSRPRNQNKVVGSHSSPRHRYSGSVGSGLEQNGLHSAKRNSFGGMSDGKPRSRIDPASLNLVSKAIEHSPEFTRKGGSPKRIINANDEWSSRQVVKKSSERPVSPNPDILVGMNGESKSMPRGRNKILSLYPTLGTDSALGSPEDIKLVSRYQYLEM